MEKEKRFKVEIYFVGGVVKTLHEVDGDGVANIRHWLNGEGKATMIFVNESKESTVRRDAVMFIDVTEEASV
ncbi:hypothetical protein OS242_10540 [Tumebacillus sp. DT12]|uniref:Uncharacterized protein n=1 Tax=Tumebacillus lacus TaxID=2995335 RepID=A0ABT3X492_9BACL|nr:hypothetical protein [Tumebacillus lacus]MCX7570400.1 hypothetical protein [Tumebacillus lacus]